MPAALIFANVVAASSGLTGHPGLRYEGREQQSPVVRDLRWYPPTPPERAGLRSFEQLFGGLEPQTPATEQVLDPAAGKATLQWNLPADAWSVEAKGHVWTEGGSRWVQLEGRRTYDLVAGGSVFEIDLESVPGHLNVDSIAITIEWWPLQTLGSWVDPKKQTTQAYISESRLPADFDRDGTLTLADLVAYSAAFTVSAPRADLNRDGRVDGEDLRIFLAAFEANFQR